MLKGVSDRLNSLPNSIKSFIKDLKSFETLSNGLVMIRKEEDEYEVEDEGEYEKEVKGKKEIVINYPVKLNNTEFINTFKEWINYRKEIKKKLTESTINKQLKFLEKQPNPTACINQSIQNGWQGLFELKQNKNNERSKSGQDTTQSADGIGIKL